MTIELLDIILIVLFFQLLTLFPFLIFQKTNRGVSNKILGAFLAAKALCITNFIGFRLYDYTFEFFPHLFYFGSSFTILWGPLLYFYIKSLTIKDFRLNIKDSIHLIPFLAHFLWLCIGFHIYNTEVKQSIMENGGIITTQLWTFYTWLLNAYILAYSVASLPLIKKYHKKLHENFSSIASLNLNWMRFIVVGFIIKLSFDIWYNTADYGSTSSNLAIYLSRLALFLFINIMIFKGLRQPYFWQGGLSNGQNKKQALSKISQEKYLKKLLSYMVEYKPYLNPDITLEELARLVDIPPRSLSWILNECLQHSFYDFVNSYRIKESERILRDFTTNYKTVLEVLFEVGFNSKSSFNSAFKKFNKMTPTEYRKLKSVQYN